MASLSLAENSIDSTVIAPEVRVESSVSFETSHKRPEGLGDDGFQTAHSINHYDVENMNLLPSKEKPELNPILSALINEDVMKSIEAKRAIEEAELEIIKAEVDAAVKAEEKKIEESKKKEEKVEKATEAPVGVLTCFQTFGKIVLLSCLIKIKYFDVVVIVVISLSLLFLLQLSRKL